MVLVGSSHWGTPSRRTLPGESTWLTRLKADYWGTGGLYVRPSGAPTRRAAVRSTPKIVVRLGSQRIHVLRGEMKLARNSAIDWWIEIDRQAGDYGPTSELADAVNQKLSNWSISFSVGGENVNFTHLVAEEYDTDDSGIIRISGTDLSHKLNSASFMEDVDAKTFQAVANEISAKYGVNISARWSTLIDYYHRVGKPIDWIRELIYPLADWEMIGPNLVVRPVEYGAAPKWSFIGREDIEGIGFKAAPWAVRNQAVVVKEVPAQGLLLEVEENASSVYEAGFFGGRGPYQFPYPAIRIQARVVRAERGKLNSWSYRGASGNGLTGVFEANSGYYDGRIPASAVQFVYEPGSTAIFTGSQLWTPGYKVRFYGQPATRVQRGVGEGGRWIGSVPGPFITPYESPFVMTHFTDAVGQRVADAYAYEGALKALSYAWRTQISPWIRPGYGVSLTEPKYTGAMSKVVFLQSVTHTWDHTWDESGQIADSGTTSYEGSGKI